MVVLNPHGSVAVVAGRELRAHGFLDESRDAFNLAARWIADGRPADSILACEVLDRLSSMARPNEAMSLLHRAFSARGSAILPEPS